MRPQTATREKSLIRPHRLLERLAADVLEQPVDPVGYSRFEVLSETWRFMIDPGVIAQVIDRVRAFLRTTRDADGSCARDLSKLAYHRADRAGRRGDQHCFPRLRRDDPVQAVPGGDAGHTERAEIGLDRDRFCVDHPQHRCVTQRVALPAAHANDGVARLESRIVGGLDDSDRTPAHHRAELLRLGVGFRIAEPPAHVRIERQERMAHQHFARPRRGNWRLDDAEIGGRDLVGRPVIEQNLEIASQSDTLS